MCGICGIVDFSGRPLDRQAAKAMVGSLAHRGPEAEGSLFKEGSSDPSVFLGHRRLKIIDLSDAAMQPMANEDGRVAVTFNGEIYNYVDLRRELLDAGHVFRSRSDTEVIVHGYEEYGDAIVEKLDGMFAFGIWDSGRRRLLLARDRCGKKPLFYSTGEGYLVFGSEIKSLLACPWIDRSVDESSIPEYLTYGYVSSPRTMLKTVRQLSPGSLIVFDSAGLPAERRYWQVAFNSSNGPIPEASAQQELRSLLTQAVRKRLMSDVPLGVFLSGGIDSSIVVSVASSISPEPIRTFTVGFGEDASFDERALARQVAERYKTDHTEVVVDIQAADLLERLVWHHDQPFGDSSAVPTFVVSRIAKQHVKVALTGDGGDESFAGYYRFLAALFTDRAPPWSMRAAKGLIKLVPAGDGYYNLKPRLQRLFQDEQLSTEERYRGWVSIFGRSELTALLFPDLAPSPKRAPGRTPDGLDADGRETPLLDRLLAFNFHHYLPGDLLVKVDRMSMANSLEARCPFLDRDVVEYAARLPAGLKIRGNVLKYILRKTFADDLPRQVLKARKHGFGVPVDLWFKKDLGTLFRDYVLSPDGRCATYLDVSEMTRLIEEHTGGVRQNGARLWALLTFEIWLRQLQATGSLVRPAGDLSL